MTLLPEVQQALLEAVERHQGGRRKAPRLKVGYRAATAVLVAGTLGAGVALGTGVLRVDGRKGVVGAVERGTHPLAPTGPLRLLGRRGSISLGRYRGEVVVMSFWAPWCEPCRQGMGALEALNRELHRHNEGTVALIAPASEANETAARLERDGRKLPVFLGGKAFLREYGTIGLPTTFVVDREGRVSSVVEGELPHLPKLMLLVRRAAGATEQRPGA